MLRAASGIFRKNTLKPTISSNPLGASIQRRGFSSVQTGGMKITPLNGTLFGIGTAGLLYMMMADRNPTAAQASTFDVISIMRAKQALAYFGGSCFLTGGAVYALRHTRVAYMNPWLNLALSLGCMIPMMMTSYYDNFTLKHLLWGGAITSISISLCPLINVVSVPVIYEALLGTGAMVGGLSAYAYNSAPDKFLGMRTYLALGLATMFGASLVMMFKGPSPMLFNFWLYGGLALFGAYVLYDTNMIMHNARNSANFDPINESFKIYLDAIQIFVRLLIIFSNNKKK